MLFFISLYIKKTSKQRRKGTKSTVLEQSPSTSTCPRGVFTTRPQNDPLQKKTQSKYCAFWITLLCAQEKKKKNKLWVDCVARMQICVHLSHSTPICVLYLFRRHVRTLRQSLSTLAIFYLSTWHIRAPSLLLHYHLTVLKGLHGGRGGGE